MVILIQLKLQSMKHEELIDITDKIQSLISQSQVKEGICIIQSMHTTAAITVNENADLDVKSDILRGLSIFDKGSYGHSEGNSPAHIKSSLIGPSIMVIIKNGQLHLGTWQGIMFCEFDGPRSRTVSVEILSK
jgi:secondary thiamine-phosphate synthase enzyme